MRQDTVISDYAETDTYGRLLAEDMCELADLIEEFESLLDGVIGHTDMDPMFIERDLKEVRETLDQTRAKLDAWRAFDAHDTSGVDAPYNLETLADDLTEPAGFLNDTYRAIRDYEEESGIPCHWRNDVNQLAETPVADRAETLVQKAETLAEHAETLVQQVAEGEPPVM